MAVAEAPGPAPEKSEGNLAFAGVHSTCGRPPAVQDSGAAAACRLKMQQEIQFYPKCPWAHREQTSVQ